MDIILKIKNIIKEFFPVQNGYYKNCLWCNACSSLLILIMWLCFTIPIIHKDLSDISIANIYSVLEHLTKGLLNPSSTILIIIIVGFLSLTFIDIIRRNIAINCEEGVFSTVADRVLKAIYIFVFVGSTVLYCIHSIQFLMMYLINKTKPEYLNKSAIFSLIFLFVYVLIYLSNKSKKPVQTAPPNSDKNDK